MDIKKVKVHMYSDNREVKTKKFNEIFDVYEKGGKYGIDWNTERSPYTCRGDVFTPFETFAPSVIFEDVESGKFYHYNNFTNSIVEVYKQNKNASY